MRGTVVVFVKAPRAGAVKTRLAEKIGVGRATALFRVMTERTVSQAAKGNWETILAVDPAGAVTGFEHLWPPYLFRIPQGRGDLGARMGRFFEALPPGPVVIVGSDAPGLRTRHLREAFQALKGADAVFGPAKDGGYWLIGMARRRRAPKLFNGVRWSTKHALKDTLKSLPKDFLVRQLERLSDIDDARDLASFGLRSVAHSKL